MLKREIDSPKICITEGVKAPSNLNRTQGENNMDITKTEKSEAKINALPQGRIFEDAGNITGIFEKSEMQWNQLLADFEQGSANIAIIDLCSLQITQNSVRKNKAINYLKHLDSLPPIRVVVYKDTIVTIDHHRLIAVWSSGKREISALVVVVTTAV